MEGRKEKDGGNTGENCPADCRMLPFPLPLPTRPLQIDINPSVPLPPHPVAPPLPQPASPPAAAEGAPPGAGAAPVVQLAQPQSAPGKPVFAAESSMAV